MTLYNTSRLLLKEEANSAPLKLQNNLLCKTLKKRIEHFGKRGRSALCVYTSQETTLLEIGAIQRLWLLGPVEILSCMKMIHCYISKQTFFRDSRSARTAE